MAKKSKEQQSIFEDLDKFDEINKEWQDMPEFIQRDLEPFQQILISFKNKEDREDFSKLIGRKLTDRTQSVWFPKAKIKKYINKRYISKK